MIHASEGQDPPLRILKSSSSPDYKSPDSLDLPSPAVIEMQGAGGEGDRRLHKYYWGRRGCAGPAGADKAPIEPSAEARRPSCRGEPGRGSRSEVVPARIIPPRPRPSQGPFLMPIKLLTLSGYGRLSVPTEDAGRGGAGADGGSHVGHAGGETEAPCKSPALHPLRGVFIPWRPFCECL